MKETGNIQVGKLPILDVNQLHYSDKYFDEKYEYRHIILPKEFSKYIPRTHLMTETEWRNLGIQQSPGWIHYLIHAPEPHVLMFRRPRENEPAEEGIEGDNNNEDEEDDKNASEDVHLVADMDYEMTADDDAGDCHNSSNNSDIVDVQQ